MTDPVPPPSIFHASDGYPLHYRKWPAHSAVSSAVHSPSHSSEHHSVDVTAPRGHLVVVHGIQSHSGWYHYSSDQFARDGYHVWFCDRRGSGLNDLQRGHVVHADRLVNDVAQFLTFVRAAADEKTSVTLVGLSWGGKLASVVAGRRPDLVDRLLLLYPALVPQVGPTLLQKLQLKLASLLPPLNDRLVDIPLNDPRLFTDVEEYQHFITNDKFALHQVNVPFLLANRSLDFELRKRMRAVTADDPFLKMPSLLALAGGDRIIHNDATRQMFRRLTNERGDIMEFAGARHSLEFEPDRDRIFRVILQWLQR